MDGARMDLRRNKVGPEKHTVQLQVEAYSTVERFRDGSCFAGFIIIKNRVCLRVGSEL